MTFESFSTDDTQKIAKNLAENAQAGHIYALDGELGAGKTAFSKGFAKGLGIVRDISSPTFAIINEYTCGRLPLYHFDVYRLQSSDDFFDAGLDDYFYAGGVSLIEWSQIVKDALPPHTTYIKIEKDFEKGENFRRVIIC